MQVLQESPDQAVLYLALVPVCEGFLQAGNIPGRTGGVLGDALLPPEECCGPHQGV